MEIVDILLAEDDPGDTELILAAFQANKMAHKVRVVSDGAETLDFLYRRGNYTDRPEHYPKVILLDLKMPRVDGMEILRQVKNDVLLKSIPVVVLTSSQQEKDIEESYSLGANAFVVKPVSFEKFQEMIKRITQFWVVLNETVLSPGLRF